MRGGAQERDVVSARSKTALTPQYGSLATWCPALVRTGAAVADGKEAALRQSSCSQCQAVRRTRGAGLVRPHVVWSQRHCRKRTGSRHPAADCLDVPESTEMNCCQFSSDTERPRGRGGDVGESKDRARHRWHGRAHQMSRAGGNSASAVLSRSNWPDRFGGPPGAC